MTTRYPRSSGKYIRVILVDFKSPQRFCRQVQGTSCYVYRANLLVPSSIYRTIISVMANAELFLDFLDLRLRLLIMNACSFPSLTLARLGLSHPDFSMRSSKLWLIYYLRTVGYELQISADSVDKFFYKVMRIVDCKQLKAFSNPFLYSNIKFTVLVSLIRLQNPDLLLSGALHDVECMTSSTSYAQINDKVWSSSDYFWIR